MASFITVMTDAGRALMADLVEGHDSLDFVSMVVGDGEYTSEEKNINTLKARTSLKSLKETYAISLGEQTSAVDVRLVSNISNYDPSTGEPLFAEGFYVNEIGVMARSHSGGSSVLFAISVVLEEQGDFLPHYEGSNPVEMVQDFMVRVSNESTVTFTYSASAFALASDVAAHEAEDITDTNGAHGMRLHSGALEYNNNGTWTPVPMGNDVGLSIVNGKLCQTYGTE